RDPDTRWLSLEGPHHQLGAIEEVEADPVEVRQRVEDQGRQVCRVGDAVGLPLQQGLRLSMELRVLAGLVALEGLGREHAASVATGSHRPRLQQQLSYSPRCTSPATTSRSRARPPRTPRPPGSRPPAPCSPGSPASPPKARWSSRPAELQR